MMQISIVVAVSLNNAIGKNGDLLWRLPNDMAHFKQITTGHHVVMGRVTYESIPPKFRPLANRTNIVITRNSSYTAEGCVVVNSLQRAIEWARQNGERELMVIGGEQIYKLALPLCSKVYMTRVHAHFGDADAFFPPLHENEWELVFIEKHPADTKHAWPYDFCEYVKKQ